MTAFGIRLGDLPDNVGVPIRLINPWDGYWLARYDCDARDGLGEAEFTAMDGDAVRFETVEAAKTFWFQQSTVRPMDTGIDGVLRENRPLSIVSIIIDTLPE